MRRKRGRRKLHYSPHCFFLLWVLWIVISQVSRKFYNALRSQHFVIYLAFVLLCHALCLFIPKQSCSKIYIETCLRSTLTRIYQYCLWAYYIIDRKFLWYIPFHNIFNAIWSVWRDFSGHFLILVVSLLISCWFH